MAKLPSGLKSIFKLSPLENIFWYNLTLLKIDKRNFYKLLVEMT